MLKAGMKLRCSGSGGNSDFKLGTDYILNEVVDEIEGTYLVTIHDDGDFLCYCLISPTLPCPHAGEWEIIG